jgi:nucleoside-diphosphate-sugar epimerase
MAIMMTGATGLIGSVLALALAESGEDVHVLCRPGSVPRVPVHSGIRIFAGDLESSSSLDEAMRGCRGVYHLAACTGVWYRDVGRHNRINVEGTRRVLYAAKRAGVEAVVVTSTASVTGPSPSLVPLGEETTFPADGFTQYEASKILMEKMITGFPSGGMRIIVVRPSRLFGPGPLHKSNSVTRMLVHYLQGRWRILPGWGNYIGNYAYINDVVRGHIAAMEKGRHGSRYHLGGENMTYRDLFRRAGRVHGRQHFLFPLPVWLMLGVSSLMKATAFFIGNEPLITPGWIRKYVHHWSISSSLAERDLGYVITPYEKAVEELIGYYGI